MGQMKSLYLDLILDPAYLEQLERDEMMALHHEPVLPVPSWDGVTDASPGSVFNPDEDMPF
jgi:hypothetical protein